MKKRDKVLVSLFTIILYAMFILIQTYGTTTISLAIKWVLFPEAKIDPASIFVTHFGIWLFRDIEKYLFKG